MSDRANTVPSTHRPAINQAGAQVLAVLASFIGRQAPAGVTEVSAALGITKNKAFRALDTLVDCGYLIRDASGQLYDIGWRMLTLQSFHEEEFDIRRLCRPFLEQLHKLTDESTFLGGIIGGHQITLDRVEARGKRVSYQPSNLMVPLHAGPASRVLMAFLQDHEITAYIKAASPLKRFTESTITEPDRLWHEVRLIRQRGYATGYGDHYTGATYIAFPVLDSSGRPHAAIVVGGPAERFTKAQLQELMPAIQERVRALNDLSRLYPVTATLDLTAIAP